VELLTNVALNKHEQGFVSLAKESGSSMTLDLKKEGMRTIEGKLQQIAQEYVRGYPSKAVNELPPVAVVESSDPAGDAIKIRISNTIETETEYEAKLVDWNQQCKKSEIAAFFALTLLVGTSVIAAPLLTWTAEPQRAGFMCEAGRCAGVIPAPVETKVDVTEQELPEVEPVADEPAETSSKAAGGPEGRFGDERITEAAVSKVPRVDGPLVERLDPRKVGVLGLVGEVRDGDVTALAEVLRGDVGATSAKLAAAMNGSDSELVLGPGTNGLSFQGDGDGGPGDGKGRLLSQGDIDTGGPGIKTRLGDPNKRRDAHMHFQQRLASQILFETDWTR
jgi:hypothetical protein